MSQPGRSAGVTLGRSGRVRVLGTADLPAALDILSAKPVENVFVGSRIRSAGIEASTLGCPVWGFERDGRLQSMCHAGANLVPVNADDEALDAWTEFAGPERSCFSIIGPSRQALGLWHRLGERWGQIWRQVRDVRPRQPVMTIDHEPLIPPDPRVRRVTLEHWPAYYDAAVRMYTEEVGVSPIQGNPAGYKFYVRQLITAGRAYALIENGRVIFKADVGSMADGVCQLQGVWIDPEFRGRGLAPAAMAAAVVGARQSAPTISLYVNDYNTAARATYAKIGMVEVGEFATVHF